MELGIIVALAASMVTATRESIRKHLVEDFTAVPLIIAGIVLVI